MIKFDGMRVLWLTQNPAGASELLQHNSPGCGWISSLQEYIQSATGIKLGIAFFHNTDTFTFTNNNVAYYPIKLQDASFTGKIYQRLTTSLYDSNINSLLKVVEDFKPDVIHLFGTETGLGEIINHTTIPVVTHLQGLINPYTYAWFPKGISKWQVLWNSSLKSKLVRTGYYFEHKFFTKRAVREEKIVSSGKYFFGRTHWDKNFIRIYNKDFEYIHCEEMLRSVFYTAKWSAPGNQELRIVTTVNPYLYKGTEIILDTARILATKSKLKFTWNVVGISEDHELIKLIEKLHKGKFSKYNVRFLGSKTANELMNELLASDVYIHPSHIDNSPNSVCESMLLGMPVIAGSVGGVSTLIDHQRTGVLYNSHDPFELAGRILEYTDNKSMYQEYGEAARAIAVQRHNPQEIVRTVIDTYHRMLDTRAHREIRHEPEFV
jgi:glycosyltransferase involved in cell wall biosynthesis